MEKQIVAILKFAENGLPEKNGGTLLESEEENVSNTDDVGQCFLFPLFMKYL